MNTRRAFPRFIRRATTVWAVVSALLLVAHVYGGVPAVQTSIAIGLLTVVTLVTIYEEYRRLPRLPSGFEIVGSHLITPLGVYCRECHVPSRVIERFPYKDSSKMFIFVYRCPSCGVVDYIDEIRLDKKDKK